MKRNLILEVTFNFFKMRRIIITILMFFTASLTAKAQLFDMLSNPQITINLVHPPTNGLKVNKIAFGPSFGRCSDQIINDLTSDFVNNNIEVINRGNLSRIMAEHNFPTRGFIDQAAAKSLGKILGPSAMVLVKVQRCATQQDKLTANVQQYDSKTKQKYTVKEFYSKTRAFLKATIQTIDLTTGRTFAAQTLEYSPERMNKSTQGFPEFPSDFEVQDVAFKMMANDVHRMFITWTEPKTLYFYDDKDFGMKAAYQALKNNDLEQAFTLSKQAMENCKNTPGAKEKILQHVNYNMGMCYMLLGEYDNALDFLRTAAKVKSGSIVNDAIASCLKQRDLAAAMQQIDDKASMDADNNQMNEDKAIQEEEANTLTNASIIDLTKSKLSKGIIIQKIRTSKCRFDTSAKALVALKNAGVNEEVINQMMEITN
jgi:tetratricopeptide (TPR) repeat protein